MSIFDDPNHLKAARDELYGALATEDPISSLRTAAIEINGRGFGRKGVESVFISVCEDLAEAGRDEESALVAYVLDMIDEW